MANRVMAQKSLKMVRMRRAYAKTFRPRNYQQPVRELVKTYVEHAQGLVDQTFVDVVGAELEKRKLIDREKVKQQSELETWLPKGCDMKFRGPGPSTPFQESWTYHNSRKDCFVVIHLDKHNGIERRSTTYSSKELLLMCWDGDAIQWVYKQKITVV